MGDSKALERLKALFDDGTFSEIDAFAKSSSGEVEVVAGFGCVGNRAAYAFSQDITADGGAVSIAQCAKIKKIYDLALKTGCPVIGIYDSNGAKLTEGFEVLNAYGELVKASSALSGVCPQIALIAGSCVGTTALIANSADVVVAVKDADFYVSAPSEITAQDSYEAGTVDILADDFESAAAKVKYIVSLLPSNNLSPVDIFDFSAPSIVPADDSDALTVIKAIADEGSVIEFKGGFSVKNCKTVLATVMGCTVGFVGFNGKPLCRKNAEKAQALVKLCDAYSIPVVTIVNANGVISDDENAVLSALTSLTSVYAGATCPKISLITGKAIGVSYITLAGRGANADLVYAWDCSVVSPLPTESAVAFLYNDRLADGENREELEKEYEETLASPFTAAACGAIDDVFLPENTRNKIVLALDILSGKRENTVARKHSVK
ncbi:MAG: carboxyl transferase [Clostridiales bacterium]|nr:carboxyl transferase [Clostridiales bacterium]